jgi:caffeoyl-CoA O-methyltransferase
MTTYNDQISRYITGLFALEDEALQHARQDSLRQGLPAISIKPEEGRFLQFLVRACGVRLALELGTLGGYSGIWIARGLIHGGRLISIEKEPRHAEIARAHFEAAGVADRVEVRVGEADSLLPGLSQEGSFDFVFIDADKPGYPLYLGWAIENTRQGGLIAAHNAFRKGSVAGQAPDDEFTPLMREVNSHLASDPRLISTIYPAGDGTLISVKL